MAQYYLNTAADDGGDGTTQGLTGADCAWNEISDITGEAAGDTISLNKGNTWQETLTVATPGSSGSPITFNSYGSGAKPIINGSEAVSTFTAVSGWTTDTTWAIVHKAWSDGADDRTYRRIWSCGTTGTKIRITGAANDDAAANVDGTSIGLRAGATEDYSAAPTRITWDTGSNTTTIAASADKTSDEITFSTTDGVTYLIHSWFDDDFAHDALTGYPTADEYFATGGGQSDTTMTEDVTLLGPATTLRFIKKIEVYSSLANLYQKTSYTTTCVSIFEDGVRLVHVAWDTDIDTTYASMSAGTWTLDDGGNILYIWCTDNADPDTHIINATYQKGINIVAKNYVDIDDIEFQKCYVGIDILSDSDYINISNTINTDAYYNGVSSSDDSSYVSITDSTFNGAGNNGIRLDGTNHTVKDNVIYDCGECDDPEMFLQRGGIYFLDGSHTGHLIEGNHVYSNGTGQDSQTHGVGIWIAGTNGTHIIRYNHVHDNAAKGIHIEATSNVSCYYNLIYNHTDTSEVDSGTGIHVNISGDSHKIYNNVVYNCRFGIALHGEPISAGDFVDNEVKNNIVTNCTVELKAADGGENDGTNGSGNVYEYNCFGAESSNFITWGASQYSTYDAWETAYGGTTNSVELDPQFTDPANDDFTLQPHSPCINAGDNVDLDFDYIGNPIGIHIIPPILPPVLNEPLSVFVNPPDIGAYGFGWTV